MSQKIVVYTISKNFDLCDFKKFAAYAKKRSNFTFITFKKSVFFANRILFNFNSKMNFITNNSFLPRFPQKQFHF